MRNIEIGLILFLIALLQISNCCYAQIENRLDFVPKLEYQAYGGAVLAHRNDMEALAKNPFFGNELRLGFQTTGTRDWHQFYNYPIFGAGVYSANFFNDIIGKPKALFLFMELPFLRKNEHVLSTNWSVGTTFNLNEYDSVSNPENIAIGTDMNVFIDFSVSYKYSIAERWEIGTGLKLQHFSNGAYAYPNLGLNMASGFVSVAYYPGKTIQEFNNPTEAQFLKKNEVTTMFAGSWRAKDIDHNNIRYFASTSSISINKRLTPKRMVGVGFDHFFQGYLVDYYPSDYEASTSDLMSYAGFLSSDMIVDRFRLVVQLGFYMYRPVDFGLFFYERVALRYYPTKRIFANVPIKAHAAKAEFIEWGLGVSF
jgi:hypothetical protein